MLAATTPQPLVQRRPPAIKAGGFMLTVAAVFSVHLLPLAWLLAAGNSAKPIEQPIQPPVLTGVLLQQAASQPVTPAAAAPQPAPVQPAPVQPAPAQKTTAQPAEPVKPQQPDNAKPQTQKPNRQKPLPTATEPVKTAAPAAEAKAETTTTAPSAAAPLSASAATADTATTEHSTANAVPVSAPVLNATAQYNAPPVYPQLSRRLREQGTVLLELTVLANGTVTDVIVLSSSGYPRLDQAALSAVQQWRYQAARRGNQSIDYRYRQRVEFSLTQGVN